MKTPDFADYNRTVVGYHGTQLETAEKIVLLREKMQWYDRPGDWMGNGMYFWEYGPKQAWRFARIRRRQRGWEGPIAVIASMIRLGNCFDLLDPDNAKLLKSMHDDYVEAQTALGLALPVNERSTKALDKSVFEYAYASIEQENEKEGFPGKIDTCRGAYVMPGSHGRPWKASWVHHEAHIQLLVRNPACILGTWMVEPYEDDDDGKKQGDPGGGAGSSERPDVRTNQEGGPGVTVDDDSTTGRGDG